MYHTGRDMYTEVQDGYCLYYHDYTSVASEYSLQHVVHTYCFRSNEYLKQKYSSNRSFVPFSKLREQRITSEQLYSWSAPIDIVERYEMYLMNISDGHSLMDLERFYNCTKYTFGPLCHFQIASEARSLGDIIYDMMRSPFESFEDTIIFGVPSPCYVHLDCDYVYPPPLCLTWRDICDGKMHCLNNGIDEQGCFELELNQCNEMKEYRCHNGQCIPFQFLNDIAQLPDCLDRSDEVLDYSAICYTEPSMRCEDHRCRPDSVRTNCGDGQCHSTKCLNGYHDRLKTSITFKPKDSALHQYCWSAITKLASIDTTMTMENSLMSASSRNRTINEIRQYCPQWIIYPSYPAALGHIYFVYTRNQSYWHKHLKFSIPTYICYNGSLCPSLHLLSGFPRPVLLTINSSTSLTCHELESLSIIDMTNVYEWSELREVIEKVYFIACPSISQILRNIDMGCERKTQLYQCRDSLKCISKFRILDGINDCPMGDDETYTDSCSLTKTHRRFQCKINGTLKCVSPLLYFNAKYECTKENIDADPSSVFSPPSSYPLISFQTLCDGFVDRAPLSIGNRIDETDETNCNSTIWSCNNTYTHCDGYWNCVDGFDELGCPSIFEKDPHDRLCDEFEHVCVSPKNYELICLPLSNVNDGHIDCLGGADERRICRKMSTNPSSRYLCTKPKQCISAAKLCDKKVDCASKEVQSMCRKVTAIDLISPSHFFELCTSYWMNNSRVANVLCALDETGKRTVVHFSVINLASYPITMPITLKALPIERTQRILDEPTTVGEFNAMNRKLPKYRRFCHRGLPVEIRSGSIADFREECLCPPAYYGSRCQYENERVALTIQFQVESEWRTVFSFFLLLVDTDGTVHSHEKMSYLSIRDCSAKFHTYLLYHSRPKNRTKSYFLRVHSFHGSTYEYRASWLYPIQFSALPVQRLSVLLKVPKISNKQECLLQCGSHGECIRYENHPMPFCRCYSGWSGVTCDVQYQCPCAEGSFCIDTSKACLCPLYSAGSRCYVKQTVCQKESSPCLNGGICIPHDERFIEYTKPYICICSDDFSGDSCQHKKSLIELSIVKEMSGVSNLLSAHFIIANGQDPHEIITTIRRIRFDRSQVRIYAPQTFNIFIVEILNDFYLLAIAPHSQNIDQWNLSLTASQRCFHSKDLFPEKIVQHHPLRRAKYYHVACRQNVDLKCFHDSDTFMCLCTIDHQANCFNFNFTSTHHCQTENDCLNNGQCFQDHAQCPTTSVCSCVGCFYGTICQFSSEGVQLSLDSILGYHIRSKASLINQPQIIRISFIIVASMFALGVISGCCSTMTFMFPSTARENGCGIYLLTLSVINLLIMHAFLAKFLLLFFTQNGTLVQWWILQGNCVLADYIVRILLSIADWLNACIAIERIMVVIMKARFDSKKSKRVSRYDAFALSSLLYLL